jgi:hypothetical protein
MPNSSLRGHLHVRYYVRFCLRFDSADAILWPTRIHDRLHVYTVRFWVQFGAHEIARINGPKHSLFFHETFCDILKILRCLNLFGVFPEAFPVHHSIAPGLLFIWSPITIEARSGPNSAWLWWSNDYRYVIRGKRRNFNIFYSVRGCLHVSESAYESPYDSVHDSLGNRIGIQFFFCHPLQ